MENKIYICQMDCYRRASEEQKEKVKPGWKYDLEGLPTDGMREEFQQFLYEREKKSALGTIMYERNYYQRICRFLKDKNIKADSFQDKTLEEWLVKSNAWLMQQGMARTKREISVYGKEKILPSNIVRYMRKIYYYTQAEDIRNEVEKDVWDLNKLDIPYKENVIKNFQTLNFIKSFIGGSFFMQ